MIKTPYSGVFSFSLIKNPFTHLFFCKKYGKMVKHLTANILSFQGTRYEFIFVGGTHVRAVYTQCV